MVLPALPAAVAVALTSELPGLADEVLHAIATEVPAYARPLEGAFGKGVRRGVQVALHRFLEVAAGPGPDEKQQGKDRERASASREVYVELGRGEAQVGRPLDALLTAYRVGARVSWSRLAAVGLRAGLPAEALVQLAASVFAYIDEISAASAAGYTAEQSHLVGERERRRTALARALLREATPAQVEEAVVAAAWTPSTTLTPVLLSDPDARRLISRWDEASLLLAGESAGPGCALALLPDVDGPGRAARLAGVMAGSGPSILGPAAPWRDVRDAAALVLRARALQMTGLLPEQRPLDVLEHLATLVVHADPLALAALRLRSLTVLDELTPAARDRMVATLRSWLAHQGDRQGVAADLGIHPQTVRYRVGLLRGLFGDDLDNPVSRLELTLATGAGLPERPPTTATAWQSPRS